MFFVGYIKGMPEGLKRWTTFTLIGFAILVFCTALLLSTQQKNYSTGQFELGNQIFLEGVLGLRPVPHLRIFSEESQGIIQTIPLVSAGKFGALPLLLKYQESIQQAGFEMDQVMCRMTGALIYNDGKALMELSDLENALISFSELNSEEALKMKSDPPRKEATTLSGEIVDPKCFFGAMNPGYGKVHRACAIMCIRGGVPPVLHTATEEGHQYYLLRGPDGERINEKILDKIAVPVRVEGQVYRYDDWQVLEVDPEKGIKEQ